MKPVDLRDITSHAVQSVEPLIAERGHHLVVDIPEAPLSVTGDHDRLVQVLTNLLTNAAKYSDPGGRIELSAAAGDEDIEIRVRDRGRGIPQELLPAVFDLFVQARDASDRSGGGLGIGLTLARRLVELHDGEIEANSEGEGRGSEFVIRLPRRRSGHSVPPPDPSLQSRPRNVLLVEDNTDAAAMLGLLLENLGHKVTVVGDGESALERFAGDEPDVLLVDLGLPGIDGYEVARRVRRAPCDRRPLLVAVTGYGQANDRRRSREAGFDYHLVKPVHAGQLARVLAAPP